jgi:hypothetical protein
MKAGSLSPLLDRGLSCPTLDQIGATRIGACDIGAVESGSTPFGGKHRGAEPLGTREQGRLASPGGGDLDGSPPLRHFSEPLPGRGPGAGADAGGVSSR